MPQHCSQEPPSQKLKPQQEDIGISPEPKYSTVTPVSAMPTKPLWQDALQGLTRHLKQQEERLQRHEALHLDFLTTLRQITEQLNGPHEQRTLEGLTSSAWSRTVPPRLG